MTAEHHLFHTDSVDYIGAPADQFESERIAWAPLTEIRSLISKGDMTAATTLVALLMTVTAQT